MGVIILGAIAGLLVTNQPIQADGTSAFGSGFDVQDFYKPFTLEEITPENQQKWPYYRHASAHWDKYALHGTEKVDRSTKPAKLTIAEGAELEKFFECRDRALAIISHLRAKSVERGHAF